MSSLGRKILVFVYVISSFSGHINASANSDLNKLQETRNSLNSCQAAVIALQDLIASATDVEATTTSLKTTDLTSPFPSTVNYPNDSTSPFDDPFSTADMPLTTDAVNSTIATDAEGFSLTTQTSPPTDSRTDTENPFTEATTETTTEGDVLSSERDPRSKRNIENVSNEIDKSHEEDGGGESWGVLVMKVISSMSKLLQEISDDPFESEYSAALNVSTNHLNELTNSGMKNKEFVLESNWESIQNASRETLANLVAAKKVVKTETKRANSTKMGTTAVICLVSILLAFVIIALVCVLLKPWRRCCKKKEDATGRFRSSSSSTTYSNYYRKTSALEGIRNLSYVESNEPASAPTMSIAAMSIPSISIPRPTVIRLADRYQPSSLTPRNCSSREIESAHSLQRSYFSYT